MTIKEKRMALHRFCNRADHTCMNCVLYTWEPVEFKACDFMVDADSMDYWSDDLICEAYDMVFHPSQPDIPDDQPTPSAVEHPKHYNREGAMECINEMVLIFGIEETMIFCKLNAWKYRYREEDLKKSDWYIRMYEKLKDGEVL